MIHKKYVKIKAFSREEYREKLISIFLKEEHGSIVDTSYYYYYVEELSDGNYIYLKRPTALNKGVDFEVRVSNVQFRFGKKGNIIATGNRPSHKDILKDLYLKKEESIEKYLVLIQLITKVFKCEEITDEDISLVSFEVGLSVELTLFTLKWLFIEQDITYWNRSGREMLYNKIMEYGKTNNKI